MIALIVARAENNAIGSKNDLPWYLPADLKHFKDLTTGHTVVMGRKTYQSIAQRLGGGLPNRRNVVLTRGDHEFVGAETIHSLSDFPKDETVFVIGGGELYAATIDIADKLYVTEVQANIDGDTFFPNINPIKWKEVSREKHTKDDKNQFDYDFVVYERL